MRAVLVGRFQPIHKGHLHTIKQIMEEYDDLVIVIGSAQYSHTPDNPFTGGERVLFIKRALMGEGLPLEHIDIIPLTDLHIHPLWIAHLKSFVPPFELAFTHNPLVKRLFKDAGVRVDETKLLNRSAFSGRHVRDLMRWGGEWETLVPDEVAKLIKEMGLDERVREVGETTTKW